MPDRTFPPGFLWGASTAAHQIEGGNILNDWWAWENEGRSHEPSGQACDSWNRWREDLDLACELGLSVFRISVEWARIEPTPGVYDQAALDHYAEVLGEARRRGLQTMVLLWHFTNPAWMTSVNDWMWREAPQRFGAYATVVAERLGALVDHWATINEANTYVWRGYIVGTWPPGRRDAWLGAYLVYRGLAKGHAAARSAIKSVLGEDTVVGLTHVLAWPHAADEGGRFSVPMQAWWNWLSNDLFLDMVARDLDWLGVQYYHDSPTTTFAIDDEDGDWPRTDLGWRIYPQGIYEVIMRAWRRYRLPMLVTENGLADAGDVQRGLFIVDHLAWVHRAIEDGADLRGYLHWSLIDNYEWAHGFWPRFGLAAVDYDTFERTLRPSSALYARVIAENALADGIGSGLTYANGMGSLGPEAPRETEAASAGSDAEERMEAC